MKTPFRPPPQTDPPLSPRQTLPTMYDLPSENPVDPGLPDEFHGWQGELLRKTFRPPNIDSDRVFSSVNLNLYYDVTHPLRYKRPDWFGVVGVSRLYDDRDLRLSYVCWQEEKQPLVAVELLSPGTEDEDLGRTTNPPESPPTKWQVYEQNLRIPYYVVFSRYTDKLQCFELVGDRYQSARLTDGRLVIPSIDLSLGTWRETYEQLDRLWLRWMTVSGEPIPTVEETQIYKAQQEIERLKAMLRSQGIDPDRQDGGEV